MTVLVVTSYLSGRRTNHDIFNKLACRLQRPLMQATC